MPKVPKSIKTLKNEIQLDLSQPNDNLMTVNFNSQLRAKCIIDYEKLRKKILENDLENFAEDIESEIEQALYAYISNLFTIIKKNDETLDIVFNYLLMFLSNKSVLNLFPAESINEQEPVVEYQKQAELFSKFKNLQKKYDLDLDDYIKHLRNDTLHQIFKSPQELV